MRLKIAICDDEQSQLARMNELVLAWGKREGHVCEVHTFVSAEAFLFVYGEDRTFDLLLLDVEMQGISGIELAKRVRKEDSHAEIVFVTSHFEFVCEGYEVDALHYLVKPIDVHKLSQVLTKASQKLAQEPPSVVINCEGETVLLLESDILYAEAFLHYTVIFTKNKSYRIKESISAFAERLSDDFYRVHRSYVASLKHVTRISRTSVTVGHAELPLSRGKYDDINRAFIERN